MDATDTTKYPDIHVRLTGTDGNACAIVGTVARAMRTAKVPADEVKAFQAAAMSGDYDHLLATCCQWVAVD